MVDSPKAVFQEITESAVLFSDYFRNKKDKPGQYYEQRVSSEKKEILKNLTADDIQNVSRFILLLNFRMENCQNCQYNFDEFGQQICKEDDCCPCKSFGKINYGKSRPFRVNCRRTKSPTYNEG